MKQSYVLLSALLAASGVSHLAAQPAPVVEVTSEPSSPVNTINNGSNVFQQAQSSGSLSDQLTSIERKLDARNRAQIKMQNQLTDLQNEVDELRGVTELHSHKLNQIIERQRELYQELDRRVNQAIKPNVPAPIAANTTGIVPAVDYSNNLTENQAYDQALNLVLKEKKYDEAITKFQQFIQKYPNSNSAANAHYWLGQLFFTKNELAQAIKEFSTVVEVHKTSGKRSDAIFKLGMIAHKQKNTARARVLYNQVMKEYPTSPAAKLATSRLASL